MDMNKVLYEAIKLLEALNATYRSVTYLISKRQKPEHSEH